MTPCHDDGIVVVVGGIDFDWDKFEAEGRALDERMRAVKESLKRQRALYAPPPAAAESAVREQPPQYGQALEARFDRLERILTETLSTVNELKADVASLKADVAALREQMVTKVEFEALRESVDFMTDGYADTQPRLGYVADLLKRYLVN